MYEYYCPSCHFIWYRDLPEEYYCPNCGNNLCTSKYKTMAPAKRTEAENAFLDSEVHKEIAARKRGTPESVERHWQSLPVWKVDQLTGRRGHGGMF